MPPRIDVKKCDDCRVCYEICPCDVFTLNDQGRIEVRYKDECWHCCACEIDCPKGAIYVELHYMMK
jgi:adenylylsulfate reductase, subunit B